MVHFVNADLIASGLSPLKPELAAIAAARMVLRKIDRLAADRSDFALETTLSGLSYPRRFRVWKRAGYRIEIVYLRLQTAQLRCGGLLPAPDRVAMTCRGVTLFERSQEAGSTLSEYIGLWPTAGP
jgi:hypothetical protein